MLAQVANLRVTEDSLLPLGPHPLGPGSEFIARVAYLALGTRTALRARQREAQSGPHLGMLKHPVSSFDLPAGLGLLKMV